MRPVADVLAHGVLDRLVIREPFVPAVVIGVDRRTAFHVGSHEYPGLSGFPNAILGPFGVVRG